MSEQRDNDGPGLRRQSEVRGFSRVGGLVCMGVGGVCFAIGIASFFGVFNSGGTPGLFWLCFVGAPLFGFGQWLVKAGFLGVGSRFVAGEVAPVAKDTMQYLGLDPAKGVRCASCGATNAVDAKFCDDCGAPLTLLCPHCQHANAGDARFCAACGKPMTA